MVFGARTRGGTIKEDGFRVVDLDVEPYITRRCLGGLRPAPESGFVKNDVLVGDTWELKGGASNRVATWVEDESYNLSGKMIRC